MKKTASFIFSIFTIVLLLISCTTPTTNEPKIYGVVNEQTYYVGEAFDPLDGVTARDENENNATAHLTYFGNLPIEDGKFTETGSYVYEILLIIEGKEVAKEEVLLIVKENTQAVKDTTKPVINMQSEYQFQVGDKYSLILSASDNIDGDISSKVQVSGIENLPLDNNAFTETGKFEISVSVSDNAGNKTSKKIVISVIEKTMYPDIVRNDLTIEEFENIADDTRLNKYQLAWADEFDKEGYPSSEYWTPEIGNGNWGWGNGEKQYYTNSTKNAFVKNGVLSINAIKENIGGFSYSSARLKTAKKVDFKYGYLEASIKLPGTGGAWPAFWLMPTNSVYGGWPASGEIDIMEYMTNQQDFYFGTAHTQNNHGSGITSGLKKGENLETSFHKYALEWTPTSLKWYFDDVLYHSYSNPNRTESNEDYWPFDQEFYFILNVAVGGTLGGNIASDFNTATMEVDYVRIYQRDYTNSDKEIPTSVSFNSQVKSNSILLSWQKASDNVGVHHYEIIVNGVHIASTTKLSYEILNLNKNTDYYIQVLAVDFAGNYSKSGEKKIKTN